MKKVILSLAVVSLALASCKKDYTCECSYDLLGTKQTVSTTIKDTKKKAKDACEGMTATYASYGASVTCAVK